MTETPKPSLMAQLAIPLGTLGAVLGAFLGGYVSNYVTSKGYYMPLVIGGVVGFMTIGFARRGGLLLALIATIVAAVGTELAPWLATDPPRKEIGDWISGQFHISTLFTLLQLASPALAFIWVMFTPARPPKKPPT